MNNQSNILKNITLNENNNLTEDTIQYIQNNYNLFDENLFKQIKQICSTNDSISLLTIDGNLITFGNNNFYTDHKILNTFIKIISNESLFCGITTDSRIIFWGDNNKKKILKYKVDKNNNEIFALSNGFLIFTFNNIYLWNLNNVTKIIKDVSHLINLPNIKIFKHDNNIYYIRNDDANNIHNFDIKTSDEQLNYIRTLIVDKLVNDKNRLFNIISSCI